MKKIMNIFLILVFFNICGFTLYYLKVIDHFYFVILNNYIDIFITNLIIIVLTFIYMNVYEKFMINKFNYITIMILGLLLGVGPCLIFKNLKIEEYLFIILYISFSITFISYSIYFETIKEEVFK